MADPTRWVTAAEPALGWPAGTFARAYGHNRHEGNAMAIEAAIVAAPLLELIDAGPWTGTASELLHRLAEIAGDDVTRQREWPKSPRAMTAALKRIAPNLRAIGVEWVPAARTGKARPHQITRVNRLTVTTVTSVMASTDRRDGPIAAIGPDRHGDGPTVMVDDAADDGHDGHDGPIAGTGPRQRDLLAAAFEIFGDDIADIYVLGTA
jgi:hypothetical protein